MTRSAMAPWLSREGKFRFELGLRQGDENFFSPTQAAEAILPARQALLAARPERHAAVLEEGAELLERLRVFVAAATGVGFADRGTALERCLELGKAWEPDFLLLKPGSDGLHRLVAGCVCFPSSWDLNEKLGKPVEVIHAPVPTLNDRLGTPIRTFLQRIKPSAMWERWNWGVAADGAWNHHPALNLPRLHERSTLENSWLRIEHQAFRPLDSEGGLLFAIRLEVLRLADLAGHHDKATRLAELLETMPEDIAAYKGLSTARKTLARQLRACAQGRKAH